MITWIKDILKVILYKPLFNVLIFFIWLIPGNNVGVAIILLTVIIRLILYPSQKKSIESQKQITEIQPELEKIKKKYANDQQAQAQAQMALYQKYKINPFSSCLPLLIQLPILFILYRVFTIGLTTDRFDLLYSFAPRPEIINTMFLGINLADPNIILAILAGVLQFIQTRQMSAVQPKPQENKKKKSTGPEAMMGDFSKQMMYIFPIFTVIIAIRLPGALALYWIITTLFMIIQQKIVYSSKTKLDPKGVSVNIKEGK